tara:strand:+ start:849 stop:1043 length:195 start_codon:yes stop_codon:yes gene_type:complete
MIFASVPKVWHLVGTWAEQLPVQGKITGLSDFEFMMVLHSIFIPLIVCLGIYLTLLEKKKGQRA